MTIEIPKTESEAQIQRMADQAVGAGDKRSRATIESELWAQNPDLYAAHKRAMADAGHAKAVKKAKADAQVAERTAGLSGLTAADYRLEALAQRHQARHGGTLAQAHAAVLATPEGAQLYAARGQQASGAPQASPSPAPVTKAESRREAAAQQGGGYVTFAEALAKRQARAGA